MSGVSAKLPFASGEIVGCFTSSWPLNGRTITGRKPAFSMDVWEIWIATPEDRDFHVTAQ
jgi:hypothetical protein